MGTETKLVKPLAGVSALINRKERTLCISVHPARMEIETARTFLYGALNTYENRFSVFIKGVPFCFLPDAYDHILPAKPFPRKPAKLDICSRCRLNRLCPGLAPDSFFRGQARTSLRPILEVPLEIVIEVNRRCNLACAVCSSGSLTEQLTLPEIRSHLAAARALGVKNIRFTGGEPFLYPQILEALAAAKKLGFYVLVNTNATLLDAGLIKKTSPFIDNILVSLQGYNAASEAAATGTHGLFFKKIQNIRLLRRSDIGVLRLGTVISKELIANFEKYRALAESLKAEIWELYRPMGTNADLPEEFRITLKDLRSLARRLEPRLGHKPQTLFANPVPFCLFKKSQAPLFLGARFDDGHTRLVLDPRGFYKPSYYIQKNLGDSAGKAWHSRLLKNISGPTRLRGCRNCVFYLRCLGGSRFMAWIESGNYSGKDPYLKEQRRLNSFCTQ